MFQPRGERARWRICYDLLVKRQVDGVLTYEEIGEALELDPVNDRHAIQMAMRRAAVEHERVDCRAVEAVPNVGYRVVTAPEHLRLARYQQRRSSRALARGSSKVTHVDLSKLEPEQRKAFEVVAQAFAMQMDFNRRFDVRQRRLEETIATAVTRQDRSEEEIAELRARLEQIEQAGKSAD